MHPFVIGFMAIWLSGAMLIGGAAFVSNMRAMLAGGGHAMGVIIPPLLMVFGVGLLWLGRWLARDEEQFLVGIMTVAMGISESPDTEV